MENSYSIEFATATRSEDDEVIDLYCEVLMAYMLVESALGECELRFKLGVALDSGDRKQLEGVWTHYQNLPFETRKKILLGDAEFEETILDGDDLGIPEVPAKKTGRKTA